MACFIGFGQENSRDRRFGVVLFGFGQENRRDRMGLCCFCPGCFTRRTYSARPVRVLSDRARLYSVPACPHNRRPAQGLVR